MGDKRAPGEDKITGEIYKCTFEILPNYVTALYNGCLRRVFPTRWKGAKLTPITKPGEENSDDVSKFHPISLLNVVESIGESFNKQNKLPCFLTCLYDHPLIRIYSSKRHNRCSDGSEEICQGRPSTRGSNSFNKLRRTEYI
jgi:hypothetical protein